MIKTTKTTRAGKNKKKGKKHKIKGFFNVGKLREDSCYSGLSLINMSVPVDEIDMNGAAESIVVDLEKLFSKKNK